MKEQIRGFNEAYKIVKKKGFEDYFCLHQTTWKDAYEKFKKGERLSDENSINQLKNNIGNILNSDKKKISLCKNCGHIIGNETGTWKHITKEGYSLFYGNKNC